MIVSKHVVTHNDTTSNNGVLVYDAIQNKMLIGKQVLGQTIIDRSVVLKQLTDTSFVIPNNDVRLVPNTILTQTGLKTITSSNSDILIDGTYPALLLYMQKIMIIVVMF